MHRRVLVPLAVAALFAAPLLAPDAFARGSNVHTYGQPTDVSDGNGGPWLTGHVYLLQATVTVPFGQTLTIQPGAIVKLAQPHKLWVNGTLSAVGTSGQPIWFTNEYQGGRSGCVGWFACEVPDRQVSEGLFSVVLACRIARLQKPSHIRHHDHGWNASI